LVLRPKSIIDIHIIHAYNRIVNRNATKNVLRTTNKDNKLGLRTRTRTMSEVTDTTKLGTRTTKPGKP